MNTNTTTFEHQVIRGHRLTGKRTIMRKFPFAETAQAINLARELNANNDNDHVEFHVLTVQKKASKR